MVTDSQKRVSPPQKGVPDWLSMVTNEGIWDWTSSRL